MHPRLQGLLMESAVSQRQERIRPGVAIYCRFHRGREPGRARMIIRRTITAGIAAGILAAALAVGGMATAQSQDGQNRRIRVHNQTGVVLAQLQAADVRSGNYGADLLGGTAVEAGASRLLTIDDGQGGCLYDLRAELAGGQTLVRENVNVCRIADYYLTR
jgi:hypothetical protein